MPGFFRSRGLPPGAATEEMIVIPKGKRGTVVIVDEHGDVESVRRIGRTPPQAVADCHTAILALAPSSRDYLIALLKAAGFPDQSGATEGGSDG